MSSEDMTLGGLKSLGRLADVRPCIVIDSREQTPLRFTRLESVAGTLTSGDYSIIGAEHLFAVERKSIADLVSSTCSSERERFERELHRLRGFRFARLLVCGPRSDVEQHLYRSNASPKAVLNTVAAFEARYNVPVVFCANPSEAAEKFESWAYWFAREIVEAANDLLRGHNALDRAPNEAGGPGTAGKPEAEERHGADGKADWKPITAERERALKSEFRQRMRDSAVEYNRQIRGEGAAR